MKLPDLTLLAQLADSCIPGGQPDFEHVRDDAGEEHSVRVTAEHYEEGDVQELSETTDITCHLEEWIDDTFVLNDPICQFELRLKVCGRIDGCPVSVHNFVKGQEIVVLRLVLVPDEKVRVFQGDFIVAELHLFDSTPIRG